jgi:hypothetical protein
MYEGIDTVVLHDELAFYDQLPVEWQASAQALDGVLLSDLEASNIALLQACILVEEQPTRDKNEELLPLAHELARLDQKLDLVLQLLGTLLPKLSPPAQCELRFNTLGASWYCHGSAPTVGSTGLLRIYLRSALPQVLCFACEVTAVSGAEVSARYLHLSERSAELIQRLCFLRHRKNIAGARKSRIF